jgi:hypothetical protein
MAAAVRRTLAGLAVLAASASAAIYQFDLDLEDSTTYIYSEGPMFVKGDTPFGSDDSRISLDLTVKTDSGAAPVPPATADGSSGSSSSGINVNIIFFDEATASMVGYGVDPEDGSIVTRSDLCCTPDIVLAGLCWAEGHVWFPQMAASSSVSGAAPALPAPPQTFNFKLDAAQSVLQTEKVITAIGEQYVAGVVLSAAGLGGRHSCLPVDDKYVVSRLFFLHRATTFVTDPHAFGCVAACRLVDSVGDAAAVVIHDAISWLPPSSSIFSGGSWWLFAARASVWRWWWWLRRRRRRRRRWSRVKVCRGGRLRRGPEDQYRRHHHLQEPVRILVRRILRLLANVRM